MANFKLSSVNDKQVWSLDYVKEYTRESGLLPYMGDGSTSIIRTAKDLKEKKGSLIHIPYFKKLSGAGVTGSATLKGAEENLVNRSCAVRVGHVRNAVMIPEDQSFRTELDIADVARASLKDWNSERLRDDLLTAAQSIPVTNGVDADGLPVEDSYATYAAATAAQRNAWLVANTDRVLVGNARANTSSGVLATALATVTPAMKLGAGMLSMAKTMARTSTTYRIRPYRSDATAGREWYVLFVDAQGMRDIKMDATILAANKDARPRDVDTNPIFQSGDLIYDGIIIREIPEMPSPGNVGNASTRVGHAVLCGQSAIALAYAKFAEPRVQKEDYEHLYGVGITEIRGQNKFSVEGVQTGMVSIFHASVLDA